MIVKPSGITPALTEACEKYEFVKLESDTMGAKRTSDDLANPGEMDASVQRFVIQQPSDRCQNSSDSGERSRASALRLINLRLLAAQKVGDHLLEQLAVNTLPANRIFHPRMQRTRRLRILFARFCS